MIDLPIYDGARRVVGIEGLLRWNEPGRGVVEPMEFIHLAEETGLIVPIGEWVIRRACAQLREWHDGGLPNLRMNVNISAPQLQQPNFGEMILDAVHDNRIAANMLQLEITESVAVQNIDVTMQVLREIRRQGVRIAIDDFGTGQSSLIYLKRFPIDTIKIDQAFVRDVTGEESAAAIVSYIINLAHMLRLEVIAEGVETEEQFAFLNAQGCDRMQGFLLGCPLPAAATYKFLKMEHRL